MFREFKLCLRKVQASKRSEENEISRRRKMLPLYGKTVSFKLYAIENLELKIIELNGSIIYNILG